MQPAIAKRLYTPGLQLGGMINRLYAVMTIFSQRFSICSWKFERSTCGGR